MEAETVHLYNDWIFPGLCHLAMRSSRLQPYRKRVLKAANGEVLEIGIGSGLNLPFYGPDVRGIKGLEPASRLLATARRGPAAAGRAPLQLIQGSAEAIPLESDSVDTIVSTWTLCSIPGAIRALEEMRRVLRPGGSLLFVEHGLAPDASVRRWQHRLNPAWQALSAGCHLDRAIPSLIEGAGFRMAHLAAAYMGGPRFVTYFYEGRATPR